MSGDYIRLFSFTGENSHKAKLVPGQGDLSIGLLGMDKTKHDVLVDDTLPINWNTLGKGFPRSLYYYGNDTGFAKWTEKRSIEHFHWFPHKSATLDLTSANIDGFSVELNGDHKVKIILGPKIRRLRLGGNNSVMSYLSRIRNVI